MENYFYVVETGGSIGECANRGNYRISSVHKTKEGAVTKRKHLTKNYGGGYYDYHFSVKTYDQASKLCKASEFEDRTIYD